MGLAKETQETRSPWIYTTRLQKGGALLNEMRSLVRIWSDVPAAELREHLMRANVLNKDTRARLADVYRRTFVPRFVQGPIPTRGSWYVRSKTLRHRSRSRVPSTTGFLRRPSRSLLTSVVSSFCPDRQIVRAGIGTQEVVNWLAGKGCPWSPTVATKVARGLLAALRDFGILEGRAQKRLASFSPSRPGVCLPRALLSPDRCFKPLSADTSRLATIPAESGRS